MKYLSILLLAVSSCSGIHNVKRDATLIIHVRCENRATAGGSGVAVNSHHVITAKHLFKCENDIYDTFVTNSNGQTFKASFDETSEDDIVRLFVYTPQNYVQARGEAYETEEVCVVFPRRGWITVCGKVLKVLSERLILDIKGEYGDSGSPVFDRGGNVVAIVVAKTENTVYAVPLWKWKQLVVPEGPNMDAVNWP